MDWLTKILIIGLILLIRSPRRSMASAGCWPRSTACARAMRPLPPANLSYIGRGLRLFVVNLCYDLAVLLVAAAIYVPAVLIASSQSRGPASPALVSLAIVMSFALPSASRRWELWR